MTTPTGRSNADAVRAFYDAYSNQDPAAFDDVVGEDYVDHGHQPPGHGPEGARADFQQAADRMGAMTYDIDALVDDGGERVAVQWTGHTPDGQSFHGLSLYAVSGGMVRATWHAAVGDLPTPPA